MLDSNQEQDKILTAYRRNLKYHGSIDDLKIKYSYSNTNDVDEIFGIIESNVFNYLVIQKMNEYENKVDVELNKNLESIVGFIKSIEGLSFYDGQFHLENITKELVIKRYINFLNK